MVLRSLSLVQIHILFPFSYFSIIRAIQMLT